MADERHDGMECPRCGAKRSLRLKWTHSKHNMLRKSVYRCIACGSAIEGWLEFNKVTTHEEMERIKQIKVDNQNYKQSLLNGTTENNLANP